MSRAGRAFLLLALAGMVGCGPRAGIPDDVLIIGQAAEPRSLDPHAATALNDFRIAANIYEGLVRFGSGTLEIEPSLAEEWTISEDGMVYRFVLREGVRFHDGSIFDAEAVRFNFERMIDPEHPFANTGPFPLAFFFGNIERIETPDSRTIELHLDEPFAPLLSNLASPTGFLVSPAAVRAHGTAYGRNPSGTGPYRFERWESNRLVRLQAQEHYWNGTARTPTLIFRPITDENARLTELLSGGVDLVAEIPPDMVAFFRGNEEFHAVEAVGPHLWFLILNTREPPFSDPRMRRAANMAVNRAAMIEHLLQGTASEAVGAIPRAFEWAVDPTLEPYPYDPDAARALIREAGQEGASITLYATESGSGMLVPAEMAVAIQADFAAVGLDVRIETFEWNTFLDRVNAGLTESAHMAQMAWMVNDPDTLPFLALRKAAWPESGGFNSGYYHNPEVDELLGAARSSRDFAERGALYQRIDRILYEDAPWVFVASWRQNAVASTRVHGLQLEPSFLFLLQDVWKTKKESAP